MQILFAPLLLRPSTPCGHCPRKSKRGLTLSLCLIVRPVVRVAQKRGPHDGPADRRRASLKTTSRHFPLAPTWRFPLHHPSSSLKDEKGPLAVSHHPRPEPPRLISLGHAKPWTLTLAAPAVADTRTWNVHPTTSPSPRLTISTPSPQGDRAVLSAIQTKLHHRLGLG
jgi:hypothetical protein